MNDVMLKEEVRVAVRTLKTIGLVEQEVVDFIEVAVAQKLNSESVSYFKVPPHVYINEIDKKVMSMDDARLGAFIRKTIWTVTGKR